MQMTGGRQRALPHHRRNRYSGLEGPVVSARRRASAASGIRPSARAARRSRRSRRSIRRSGRPASRAPTSGGMGNLSHGALHPVRHAADDDRVRADGDHRHAGDDLHRCLRISASFAASTPTAAPGRATLKPSTARLLDRRVGGHGRRRPLRHARGRDAAASPAPHLRRQHPDAQGRPDASSRSGLSLDKAKPANTMTNEVTDDRQRADAAVDGDAHLSSLTKPSRPGSNMSCDEGNRHVARSARRTTSSATTAT